MSDTFLSSYLRQVTASLPSCYEDNYDSRRFGPQPDRRSSHSWKKPIVDYLRSKGYVHTGCWPKEVVRAVQLVEAHLPRFECLYGQLADPESRDILVMVLAYRALGHRRVKLPLNTPAYWDGLLAMEQLASPSDPIRISYPNWQLHLVDLSSVGAPVKLYTTATGAYGQFVSEHYRCSSGDEVIAVEAGDYVIDAGACWGDTALYFANRSGPDGRVFSYEFSPENLAILRRNLALNPELSNHIHVVERAAWAESDVMLSLQGEGPATRVTVGEVSAPDAGALTLTIDDLVEQENLPRVDFIKMDIEGAELPALRGASRTIERFKPKLAVSVYHRLTDFLEIPEFLASLTGARYRFFMRHNSIHREETVLFCKAGA